MKLFHNPFHPLLLAVYFPILLLSKNMAMFNIEDTYRVICVNIGLVLVAFTVCHLVYRDRNRAAFVTTALLGLIFSFSFFNEGVFSQISGIVSLGVIIVTALVIVLLAFKIPQNNPEISQILNVVVAVMLVAPVYRVASAHFAGDMLNSRATSDIEATIQNVLSQARSPDKLPTVFHIVLDGYSRNDVLQEIYGYDNSSFTNRLREFGFFVADRSTTPYGQTLLVVNSVFSMNYLNSDIRALESRNGDLSSGDLRRVLKHHLWTAPVLRMFGEMGYRLAMIDSDYAALNNVSADYFLTPEVALTSFEKTLLAMTPVSKVLKKFNLDDENEPNVKLIFALGDHDYERMEKPLFVLNHIVSPHPPFTIDRDGRPRPDGEAGPYDGSHRIHGDSERRREYRNGYIEKLRYTNGALIGHVQSLIEDVSEPKVIIIHGDHGGGLFLEHNSSSTTCLKERFSPFLAVYATDHRFTEALEDDTNLVNLYRVLFNTLFDTDLPLLPARSFFAPWKDPTDFQEINGEQLVSFGPNCEDPAAALPRIDH
jgi:hypothetical protein